MAVEPFRLNTAPLTETVQKIAEKEIRETPQIKEEAILKLRELLHNATDLYFRDDDDFLITFLRPCHFYPESALRMVIYNFYYKYICNILFQIFLYIL